MILLVDDKQENILALKNTLNLYQFKTDTASSGKECLKKALRFPYELIILDVQMPGMDGFEVAHALSQYSKTEDIPIIFLSAVNISKDFVLQGLDHGARDYLIKPVDPDILVRKIRNYVNLFKNTRELKATQEALQQEIENKRRIEARKEEFVSMICHELNTPLTSIKGYVQLALRAAETGNNTNELLNRSVEQTQKLERLIADLMNSNRISNESLTYKYEIFPLDIFLEKAIDAVKHSYPSRHIALASKPQTHLFGDPVRLEQALINLLSNALKYSPPESPVDVLVDFPDKTRVRIQVKDNGIGIPEDRQSQIFQKFYRAGHTAETVPGLGLGLYISEEIIRHHTGEIGFSSKENEGSVFYFILPVYHP